MESLLIKSSKYGNIHVGDISGGFISIGSGYTVKGDKRLLVRCLSCSTENLIGTQEFRKNKHGCKPCSVSKNTSGFKDVSGRYFTGLKAGAHNRGIEFSITAEDVYYKWKQQNEKCMLSGLPVSFNSEYNIEDTASVDRIDSSKAYTINNIQILHKTINQLKWDIPQDEFIHLCSLVYKNSNK